MIALSIPLNELIFWQNLSDVATELGVTVDLKHKKINISNPRVSKFFPYTFKLVISSIHWLWY